MPEGTPIDLERLRSVGVIGRRSGSRVDEGRDEHGRRWKATTDELNNTVTQRHDAAGEVCQDVLIRAPHLRVSAGVKEERT